MTNTGKFVHHIDGDPANNALANLVALTLADIEIRPALSAQEWATLNADETITALATATYCEWRNTFSGGRRAIAAMALHGQSFGFTWADVDALEEGANSVILDGESDLMRSLQTIRDRIAALLPPR